MNMKGISVILLLILASIFGLVVISEELAWDHNVGCYSWTNRTSNLSAGQVLVQNWTCPTNFYEVTRVGWYFNLHDWGAVTGGSTEMEITINNHTTGTQIGNTATFDYAYQAPDVCDYYYFTGTIGAKIFPGIIYNITYTFPAGTDPSQLVMPLEDTALAAWELYEGYNASLDVYGNKYLVTNQSTTNINQTTAKLNGYLNSTCGYYVDMGFWVGNVSLTEDTKWKNVTVSTVTNGTNFATVTGLETGGYYYVRPWAWNYTLGFATADDDGYFMTKPNAPSGLSILATNATNMTLGWTNATGKTNATRNTLIRYSTSDYPATPDSGSLGYNGTAEEAIITGLDSLTTYYFSAWTYIQQSGSPTLWWYSDLYDTATSVTGGGSYNISIVWECSDEPVNLSNLPNNFTLELSDGSILNSSSPTDADGTFTANASQQPEVATFSYNDSVFRSILLDPGTYNYTIYIPCGSIGTTIGDIAAVTISFVDGSGYLTEENEAIGYLYRYNGSTKEYIHMEYLQADSAVRAYLTVGNEYYVGTGCSVFDKDNLGALLIFEDSYTVSVFYTPVSNATWFDSFDITYGWDACTTLFLDLEDTTHSGSDGLYAANCTLFYMSNDTYVYSKQMTTPWNFNFTYASLNASERYYVAVNASYATSDLNWTSTFYIYYLPCSGALYNGTTVDDALSGVLGTSPVVIGGVEVSWLVLMSLALFSGVLFLFSPRYAGMGVLGGGLIIAFLKFPLGLLDEATLPSLTVGVIIFIGFLAMMVTWRYKR